MHYPIRSGNTAAERKQSSCFGVAGDKTRMSLRFWYAACFVSVVARRTIDLQRNKTIAVETEHSTVEVTEAPSSFNSQPWRFIYSLRNTVHWDKFLGLLVPFNQEWAQHASALVFAVSTTTSRSPRSGEEHPLPTHSFDTGAACACMAFQALKLGWYMHGMVGFDHERARTALNLPVNVAIDAAFAIGGLGDKGLLPEALRTREIPSDRLPIERLVFEGAM